MILSFSWILQLSKRKKKNNVHAFFWGGGGVGGGLEWNLKPTCLTGGGGVNGGMQIRQFVMIY